MAEMEDDFNKYGDLTRLMKNASAADPPADFTARVMARLMTKSPALNQGIWARVKHVLTDNVTGNAYSGSARALPAANTNECSFYFFITGFFYLIIGIVLLKGFKATNAGLVAIDWIRLQPHVTLATGTLLLILGIMLLRAGKNTIKVIRFGTIFYILLAIVNGSLINLYFIAPYAGVFVFGFIGAGVIIGLMLASAVQKVELRVG